MVNKVNRPKRTLATTIIEPFKQIKLGIYVLAISVVFLVFAGLFFYQAFAEQYKNVMEIFGVVDQSTQLELITNDIFIDNGIKLAVLFVSYLCALFFIIFKTTHKYYGPLVSIERFVTQITSGDYRKRVKIRKGDELGRLVQKLNDMAQQLENRHGAEDRRGPRDEDHDQAS